jgi:hypothetical protein
MVDFEGAISLILTSSPGADYPIDVVVELDKISTISWLVKTFGNIFVIQ